MPRAGEQNTKRVGEETDALERDTPPVIDLRGLTETRLGPQRSTPHYALATRGTGEDLQRPQVGIYVFAGSCWVQNMKSRTRRGNSWRNIVAMRVGNFRAGIALLELRGFSHQQQLPKPQVLFIWVAVDFGTVETSSFSSFSSPLRRPAPSASYAWRADRAPRVVAAPHRA